MIVSSQWDISAVGQIGPIYPAGGEIRISLDQTAGVARAYASTSPRQNVIVDESSGLLTAASFDLNNPGGLKSGWINVTADLSSELVGFSAVLIIVDSGTVTASATEFVPDDVVKTGSGFVASISTSPAARWGIGEAMLLSYEPLRVESVEIGGVQSEGVTARWLDGSPDVIKGGSIFGAVTMRVPDIESAGNTALAVASIDSSPYVIKFERIKDGDILESRYFNGLVKMMEVPVGDQIRSIPVEIVVINRPLHVIY
ncbi:hypothetical protein [Candidatus Macondimonas diazotrophica]|jgi:hypothetical protein|uniref:Uncharacterized protein n=1 Tax=Candidatus Macondimonas diazotrophica TaxID=2305248 RepID=A0A4Z0F4P6_9GAMM|nr:hypothetical protein [Candidatus Macondimonas diazotrophica]TFZ81183.1 hypothetical protein E4680_13480 [Candidatus Macondimonas diazotrophica]